jgi:vacuolar-type H+-ATPase subunit I/STV1
LKKFTIITPPEYETQVLGELGKASVVQLKEVMGADFERLTKDGDKAIDYKSLYDKYHEVYQGLIGTGFLEYPSVDASITELREFMEDPEGEVESILNELNEFKKRLEDREKRLLDIRTRLERVRALQPEEFRRCLDVGIIELQLIPRLVEHLKRFGDLSHKLIEISEDTGYIFVFGPENRKEWVETLFVVFDVRDVFEVLSTGDILLALDDEMRDKVIKEYEEEAEKLQLLVEREEEEEVIKDQIEKIQDLVKIEGKEQYGTFFGKARFYDYLLGIMANKTIPVLRTKVLSVIQGWIEDEKLPVLEEIRKGLEEDTGKLFFVQIEEPSHDDHAIPTPPPEIKPSFLQPAWTLTTLRGWPSAHEFNPAYITILIFSFQFGLMFGDIGQGAIFLVAGIFMSSKFKTGLASKLGAMFIPMGISAIIFGFLYDSIFLMEGLLFHHHQIMPNPINETTSLLKLVFLIAAVEIIFGLIFGAINEYKEGHKWGVLGEHGLGMILYIAGLYLSAMHFIRTGDFMAVMGYWAFYMMIGGMVLAMLEPIIASIAEGHFSIEVVGEGVGALLMTFVEGLANIFSFLRIAAFALAHGSLAVAAHQLGNFMGTATSLVLMNLIAMSFEFVSSSVQSLRLLYYEFMGKFYQGEGVPFRPFRLRSRER